MSPSSDETADVGRPRRQSRENGRLPLRNFLAFSPERAARAPFGAARAVLRTLADLRTLPRVAGITPSIGQNSFCRKSRECVLTALGAISRHEWGWGRALTGHATFLPRHASPNIGLHCPKAPRGRRTGVSLLNNEKMASERREHHSDVYAQACENARTRQFIRKPCRSWNADCVQSREIATFWRHGKRISISFQII